MRKNIKGLIGAQRVFNGKKYQLVMISSVKRSAKSRAADARVLEGKSARVIGPNKNFRAYAVYVEGKEPKQWQKRQG